MARRRRVRIVGGLLALLAVATWVLPVQEAAARRKPPAPQPDTPQVVQTFEFTGRRSLVNLALEFAESGPPSPGVGGPPVATPSLGWHAPAPRPLPSGLD